MLLPEADSPGRKNFLDGTHRVVAPAETLARVAPLMREMGITRIANITGLDRIGIPVAVAIRPNSRNLAVSQGKGLTLDAARASALMESVEHYHAESIVGPTRYGCRADLASAIPLVEPHDLPGAGAGLFHDRLPIVWMEGYDLLRREPIWLPFDIVSTNYTRPLPPGHGCFQSNSNGLASGNHLLEAVSQAMCEVVERDALALWHLSGDDARDAARVDLGSVEDADCRDLLERYAAAGIEVTVWDLTSDIGIPAFRCMIAERGTDPLHAGYMAQGMGCHPSRSVALVRALTEAAQSRLTYIAGSRDDVFRDMYARLRDRERTSRRRRQLRPGDGTRDFRRIPEWQSDTFEADVQWALDRLAACGVRRVVAVILTSPRLGIPVVKVVVPGLEGFVFDARYTAGPRARRLQEQTT